MSYRATNDSSTQTNDERADEARRIMAMGLMDNTERMTSKEREFIERLDDELDQDTRPPYVSVKQLWWLRDLKEKYL